MADLSQTLPGAADGAAAMTPNQRLQLRPGIEDLGETSFFPVLFLISALLVIFGGAPSLAVTFGALLLALSIQLALRLPHLALPAVFREPLVNTPPFQRLITAHLSRKHDGRLERKRIGHWATLPPFDMVPRVLLGVVGIIAIMGSGVSGIPTVMGIAAILITLALAFRSVLALLCGAATISLSSLIPLLSS